MTGTPKTGTLGAMKPDNKVRRRAGLLALIGILALALSGCFRMDIAIKLEPDDTASGFMVFAISDSVAEAAGQTPEDLWQQMKQSAGDGTFAPDGADVEPYHQDGYTGEKYILHNTPLDDVGGDSEDSSLSIKREGDEYVVTGRFDMTGTMGEAPDETTKALLKQMKMTIAIEFPGEVKNSNGTVTGHTVTWNVPVDKALEMQATGSAKPNGASKPENTGKAEASTPPTAEGAAGVAGTADTESAKSDSGFSWWIIAAAVGALVVLGAVVLFLVLRKKKAAPAASAPGQFGAPAGFAPPPADDAPPAGYDPAAQGYAPRPSGPMAQPTYPQPVAPASGQYGAQPGQYGAQPGYPQPGWATPGSAPAAYPPPGTAPQPAPTQALPPYPQPTDPNSAPPQQPPA